VDKDQRMSKNPERDTGEDDTLAWDSTRTSFTQIPDWILFHDDVNDAALRTWLTIASYVDNKTRGAFPKVSTLATKRGKGRRQIFDHLDQLEAAGLLQRKAQYRPDGRRKHSHYTLAWQQPLQPLQHTNHDKVAASASSTLEADSGLGAENRTVVTDEHPRAENHTGVTAENRSRDRAENRAPRTTPKKELDPLTPEIDDTAPDRPWGATAPQTPRQESGNARRGSRAEGTNPRAVHSRELQETGRRTQMIAWARTMNIPAVSLEDFQEMVDSEVRSGGIRREDAEAAIAEARLLRHPADVAVSDDPG